MATATTGGAPSSTTAIPPFVAPIIEAFAQAIRPSVNYIMISTVFSAMLLPLVIALFYFSTAESRRRPIFILNVASISLGLLIGIINAHLQIDVLFSPLRGANVPEDFAWNIFYIWSPWVTEAVLILRLVAVFHPRSKLKLLLLLAFPIVVKTIRAAMFIIYLRRFKLAPGGPYNPVSIARLSSSWFAKVAFIFELLDNLYMSGMFLLQLYNRGHPFGANIAGRASSDTKSSFRQRIRTLFFIAATSFVFPVILDLCQIGALFTDRNYLVTGYIGMVNLYTSIICTVLATVWSQSLPYQEMKNSKQAPSRLRFAERPPTSFFNSFHQLDSVTASKGSITQTGDIGSPESVYNPALRAQWDHAAYEETGWQEHLKKLEAGVNDGVGAEKGGGPMR